MYTSIHSDRYFSLTGYLCVYNITRNRHAAAVNGRLHTVVINIYEFNQFDIFQYVLCSLKTYSTDRVPNFLKRTNRNKVKGNS